jgi:hypothetical protein
MDETDCASCSSAASGAAEKKDPVITKRLFVAAAVAALVGGVAYAQSTDPQLGTWKLNGEKSKGTMFVSGTVKAEAAGEGMKTTVDLVRKDGSAGKWSFTAAPDGKDYPVTGDSPFGDTISVTRADARTLKVTLKNGGKVTATQTVAVSADGKTRTITTKGTTADGKPIDSQTVYERQ